MSSCSFVMFGATGDLVRRLLMPALYNLAATGLFPDRCALVGVAREKLSSDTFRRSLVDALREYLRAAFDSRVADRLLASVHYVRGDIDSPRTYASLANLLVAIEDHRPSPADRLFYLALPPMTFATVATSLAAFGLTAERGGAGWRRVIVEKPFGVSLDSARALDRELADVLGKHQLYRIDHYLGKASVQNIQTLRFGNGIFEPVWNRDHIDHVQITVAETVTVERRGRFYDATGALRDMVPNHLFQMLAAIAMEPPSRFDAVSVHRAKAELLDAVRPGSDGDVQANVVRGQYRAGAIGAANVPAYRDAPYVDAASSTETYVALKLRVDTARWTGVPFYLRTGKALSRTRAEVAITFKRSPTMMFSEKQAERLMANVLVLEVAPDEGVGLRLNAKSPNPSLTVGGVDMRFSFRDYFDAVRAVGYEKLIHDCMMGDATLFQSAGMVEAGWRAVAPFVDAWAESAGHDPFPYPAGSEGPPEADALLARDGRAWRPIEQEGAR
ncbi:MAG: glucose-6-phosphate dehydrogenase [Burkholderiales bacterium]|nr:glucose-6-phosphate dehydrogenase [Burkholderiales bacterium]